MSILSFHGFRKRQRAAADPGWSQSDLAEFYRAHKLLNDQGILVGLDQGLTDELDPWLIFYDHETHDVFLHIARIDGKCILLCEHLSISIQENQIADLVQKFEATVRNLLDNRSKQNSNVITHPAARIITTVAAVFLLFKIESNQAHADSFFEKKNSNNIDNVHSNAAESRLLNIHRSSLSRIFETIDTPLHAAMMAGFVISNAIASQHRSEFNIQDEEYIFSVNYPKYFENDMFVKDVNPIAISNHQEQMATYETTSNINNSTELVKESRVDEILKVISDANRSVEFDSQNAIDIKSLMAGLFDSIELQQMEEVSQNPESKSENVDITSVVIALNEVNTKTKIDVFNYLSFYDFNGSSILHISVNNDKDISVFSENYDMQKLLVDNKTDLDTRPEIVGNISIRDLEAVSTFVEKHFETKLHYTDLGEMLKILMAQFDNFEIQIFEGNILVEQGDIAETPYSEVALWTNTMADGSEISFIGSLDIIDDVTFYMA
jgi:hypothetical protein